MQRLQNLAQKKTTPKGNPLRSRLCVFHANAPEPYKTVTALTWVFCVSSYYDERRVVNQVNQVS